MKIILDNSHQQESQEQQQFVIIQSQSLAGKTKLSSDEAMDDQDDVVYVLKEESGSDPNVIQLESNCGNQEQFVWIANEQGGESTAQGQAPSTLYTIKELNYAQVSLKRFMKSFSFYNLLKLPGYHKLNSERFIRCQQ